MGAVRYYTAPSHAHQILTRPFSLSYLLEHGLTPEGRFNPDLADEVAKQGSYDTFFTETSGGKYVPRSVFVDLDPSVCGIGW